VQILTDYIVFNLKKAESLDDIDTKETWSQLGYDVKDFTTPAHIVSLKSNFLTTEEELNKKAPEPAKDEAEDKENKPDNEVDEKKEEEVDESKLTEEEREALAKKREEEVIGAIVDKARTQR
jgi:hypothetical protein